MIEITVCRTCQTFGRILNNFGECGDCSKKREQSSTQELAQKILERIAITEKQIQGGRQLGITSADVTRLITLKDDIKQLCQEVANKQ